MDWTQIAGLVRGAWNYAPLLNNPSGPIRQIETRFNKERLFETWAHLNPEFIKLKSRSKFNLYSEMGGQGTSSTKWVSVNMAISEALERWAYFHSAENQDLAKQAGLDVWDSTAGFAAFPGSVKKARDHAWKEGKERWDILSWWAGKLEARLVEERTIEIVSPLSGTTVILFDQQLERAVYGFAAARNIVQAIAKARIELERNRSTIQTYLEGGSSPGHVYERRMLFFSHGDGYQRFRERLMAHAPSANLTRRIPVPLIDREIKGPWSEYTKVWRVLFSGQFDDGREDTFLF